MNTMKFTPPGYGGHRRDADEVLARIVLEVGSR